MTQLVKNPTFRTNVLDLVITDDPDRIFKIDYGPPIGSTKKNSLHGTLTWNYTLRAEKMNWTGITRRNYHKCDFSKFSEFLTPLVNLSCNPDSAYDELVNMYQTASKECVPFIIPNTNRKLNKKWFNQDIKRLTNQKFNLYCKMRASTENGALKHEYNQVCKKLRVEVKKAILEYETKLVSKCKSQPKTLYSYINNQKACRDHIRAISNTDGTLTTNESEIANILNEQFCRVFNERSPNTATLLGTIHLKQPNIVNVDYTFSVSNVAKALNQLDTRKSIGPDGVHPIVLKNCASEFSKHLSHIFCQSFKHGMVPTKWKQANITPIFKKGEKVDPANYRPISLTSVPGKVMEKLVRDVMMDHLERNGLISKNQHGFVHKKSCLTNLLETMDTVTNAYNNGQHAFIVFLDFQKAFDKVCHASLLYKLKHYGYCQEIIDWVGSYLENRKQRVVMGEYFSDWMPVSSGVPQGSVLGPLLFVIYINDMPAVVNHVIKLFADDSKLIGIIKNKDDHQLLQGDLDALVKWAKQWKMLFHPDKCKVMEISKSNGNLFPPLSMEETDSTERHTLELTSVERDLGVMISNNLKQEEQVANAVAKAYKALSILRRTFSCWTPNNFKTLYIAYVRPHLEYAVQAWSPYFKKDIEALELVQRKATKLVKEFKHLDYLERLEKLGLTTLEERRNRGDLIQFFKEISEINIINWQIAPLTNQSGRVRRNSNSNNMVRPAPAHCLQRENFFISRVIHPWNSLPQCVVDSITVNQFKNRLDKHLSKDRTTTMEAHRLGKINY